ncbi:MAG TPA: zinc-binding alcohol dehydrogenase family protein [Candidatus Dadabacteria bacterium]|nr:zinc-binding alcohol dehydrogenase family protein [Candidatus Dadabacteria bacterium]
MQAIQLQSTGKLVETKELNIVQPGQQELLIRVTACGICRTDLHILDGELTNPKLPLVLGHEIVGRIERIGKGVKGYDIGQRVGVPWLGYTCGDCNFCTTERENLCPNAKFTGYHIDGGYSEYTLANHRYCLPIDVNCSDSEAAPLLCAGLIGYRSLRMTGDPKRLGIYGFGVAAHIITQVAIYEGREVYVFTRPGDEKTQNFAYEMGAKWAGGSDETLTQQLDSVIIFAPVGELVPIALQNIAPGGRVVCGGIHMSDIPQFSYDLLWGERSIHSVANLTRQDGIEFLQIAKKIPVNTHVVEYPLSQASKALDDVRNGDLNGAAVLVPGLMNG